MISGMNDFLRLSARQVATDFRMAPRRARAFLQEDSRAARAWTIGELRAAARRRIPEVVFDYLDGAAGDELTAQRNLSELRTIELKPHVLVDVSQIDTSTSVLGKPVSLPLLGAPMGLAGLLHPGGEVALARALSDAGSICVVSAMASCPIEEVAAAASEPTWFQMYIWRDRGLVQEMLRRARAAGVSVLVVTADVPCSETATGIVATDSASRRGLPGALSPAAWLIRTGPGASPATPGLAGAICLVTTGWPRRRSAPTPTGSSTRPRPGRSCAGSASAGAARW